MSVCRRVSIGPKGVGLLAFPVGDARSGRFHVSDDPSVVNLVIVPLPVSKAVIAMTFHLQEIQGYDLYVVLTEHV